jgi:hypothetical protein
MNEPISASNDSLESELGKILSDRKALRMVDGRCSAAQAECLTKLRDRKLYLCRSATWDQFCPRYLGITKLFANRAISALEAFGPSFFDLAQLTRITPDEFRMVAPRIKSKILYFDGDAIALIPENIGRITAVMEKLRGSRAKPAKTYTPPTKLIRITLLERQCTELVAEFRKLSGPRSQDVDRSQLATVLRQTLGKLGRIELDLGVY